MKMKINFKITNANFWRMVGFYGCLAASALMAYSFVWMFFGARMESTADVWGVRYLQFLCLVAGVFYAYLARKNNHKAQLLDKAEAVCEAYYAAPDKTEAEREAKYALWNKYLALSAEADR